jgi:predicted DCC family thiol-disulfide oxidoreductase YuxK
MPAPAPPPAADGHPVLFFDGVCGLCNVAVDWLIARDPEAALRFAPLQGETAAEYLPPGDTEQIRYLVLLDDAGRSIRTAAVIRALSHLGGRWAVAAWALWCVPAPLRNLGYHAITKVRYLIWGKKETCRLPTPEERTRFLP